MHRRGGGAEFLEIARDTSLGEMNGDFEILVSPVCMVPPCQCNALQYTSIHFKALQGTSMHFNARKLNARDYVA